MDLAGFVRGLPADQRSPSGPEAAQRPESAGTPPGRPLSSSRHSTGALKASHARASRVRTKSHQGPGRGGAPAVPRRHPSALPVGLSTSPHESTRPHEDGIGPEAGETPRPRGRALAVDTHRGPQPPTHDHRDQRKGPAACFRRWRGLCACLLGVARGGVEPPTFRFSGGRSYQLSYLAALADTSATAVLTGFEPAASTLTGWRALLTAPQDLVQLSHRVLGPVLSLRFSFCQMSGSARTASYPQRDSNPRYRLERAAS